MGAVGRLVARHVHPMVCGAAIPRSSVVSCCTRPEVSVQGRQRCPCSAVPLLMMACPSVLRIQLSYGPCKARIGESVDDACDGKAIPALGSDRLDGGCFQAWVLAHHCKHVLHGAGLMVVGCGR